MTADDFRRTALGLPDAVEGAHMGHADFRVNGKIFATLHHGNKSGMVKLTPEQQKEFVRSHPASFAAESGAWGRAGCTKVLLAAADPETVGDAMTLAYQNTAKRVVKRKPPRR